MVARAMSTLLRSAFVLTLLAAPSARATEIDSSYDGIVTDAAVVPVSGTVRLAALGGTFGPSEGFSGALAVSWAFFPSLELNASGRLETTETYSRLAQASPALALRWQPLAQERFGVNLAATARFKTVGFDPSAGEYELGLALGRTFGPVLAVVNFVAGHEVDPEGGMDLEAHAQADVAVLRNLNVGVEARYRTGRDPEFAPTFGSTWDVVAGPRAVLSLKPVRLQALVGYSNGNGPNFLSSGGLFGLIGVTADLH
jgi:hypothetical protein